MIRVCLRSTADDGDGGEEVEYDVIATSESAAAAADVKSATHRRRWMIMRAR